MEALKKLHKSYMKKYWELKELKDDEENKEKNKGKIAKLEKEMESLKNSIEKIQQERTQREKKIKDLEQKIPRELKDSNEYKSVVSEYISQNSSPYIGDIIVTDDGRVIFKYGGIPEIDDGKRIMQFKNGLIYTYEDNKGYDFDTREDLIHMRVKVEKTDLKGRIKEKFSIIANCRGGQWSYKENELDQWKNIGDISQLPIKELLSKYSISYDLGQFLNQNYTLIQKKEQIPEKINPELQEDSSIAEENALTVEDLRKMYDYIFYDAILYDSDNFIGARELEKGTQNVINHLFFLKKNGVVIPIPELKELTEGDIINGKHYKHINRVHYRPTRNGSHTFDIEEKGSDIGDNKDLEHIDRSNNIYRYNKYYRYVTLDNSQKIVKVFESEQRLESAKGNLYHRNKDENGELCIRLVDLEGNVHSIKESGKAGEKGLKEKTFGHRGDCQLKVVYKDKEPVYALFIGNKNINSHEFCTAEELRDFFERQKQNFKRFGWSMDEDSCFYQMEAVIETFNETFMKGNFVPSTQEITTKKEEKSLTELSEELSKLTKTEEQAKQLLKQYEEQLPDISKGEI